MAGLETRIILLVALAVVVAVAVMILVRRRVQASESDPATPEQQIVLDAIERILDNPPSDEELAARANDPWNKLDMRETLAGGSSAGSYSIDADGVCTLISLLMIEMIWPDADDFPGVAGLEIENLLHGVGASTVLASTRNGDACHRPRATISRADGSTFEAEIWSRPTRRDGEVIGAQVSLLDRTDPLVGIFAVDLEGRCQHYGHGCLVLLHGHVDEGLQMIDHDLHSYFGAEPIWNAVADGESVQLEETDVQPIVGPAFKAHVAVRPLEVEGVLIGAVLTVTDRRA